MSFKPKRLKLNSQSLKCVVVVVAVKACSTVSCLRTNIHRDLKSVSLLAANINVILLLNSLSLSIHEKKRSILSSHSFVHIYIYIYSGQWEYSFWYTKIKINYEATKYESKWLANKCVHELAIQFNRHLACHWDSSCCCCCCCYLYLYEQSKDWLYVMRWNEK